MCVFGYGGEDERGLVVMREDLAGAENYIVYLLSLVP